MWKGTAIKVTGARVGCAQLCLPKSEGGLGLRRVADWNKACFARIIWLLFKGSDSLWIAWMKEVLIKERCFWSLVSGSNCSWCWRRLLKIRDQIRPLIFYRVGNGELIHIWIDNWHLRSPLVGSYGTQIIYASGLPLFARRASVISNGHWNWPLIRSSDLADIFNTAAFIIPGNDSDIAQWVVAKNLSFTVSSAWNAIRVTSPKVDWGHLVWSKAAVPKHSFIHWLAQLDKLHTKDMISKYVGGGGLIYHVGFVEPLRQGVIFFRLSFLFSSMETCL